MSPEARSRRFLAAAAVILVVALAVRVGYVLGTSGYTPLHDDHAYDHLALGIARTGVFPDVGHRPTAYRPPGFPYLLGAVYALAGTGPGRIVAARLVQAAIGTAVVALLGLVARRLFGRGAALGAMAAAALYVPLVAAGTSLLCEPLAVALELAGILAVLAWRAGGRRRWVVAAGIIGGLLILTRSNAFVVVVAMAAGLVRARPRISPGALRPAAAALGVAVLVVAPWTVRNAVVVHSFVPVSDELGGTLAGTYNPVSDHDPTAPAYWHLLAQIPGYRAATLEAAGGPEPAFQSRLLHLAAGYAAHHPLYPAKVAAYNTLRLADLGGLGTARYTATLAGITSPGVADAGVFSFWVVLAAAIGGWAVPGVRRRVPGFVRLAAVLLLLSVVLVSSETPRLRLPLDPFLLLVAGAGLAAGARALGRRRDPAAAGRGSFTPTG